MTYLVPTATADEGWGQELGPFFISKLAIDNQAEGGANVLSFHSSSRWNAIMNNLRAGDYVMAAFGANDSGTTHGPVAVPTFQGMFETMADEVKGKQATFIPVTPSALQQWVGTKETNTRIGPYAMAEIVAGMAKGLLVDDLNARSVELLNMIGQTAAMRIYKAGDKAHFTKQGATQMAQFVAQELKRIGTPWRRI
jgi:lysophospholipase L1-like esterase